MFDFAIGERLVNLVHLGKCLMRAPGSEDAGDVHIPPLSLTDMESFICGIKSFQVYTRPELLKQTAIFRTTRILDLLEIGVR